MKDSTCSQLCAYVIFMVVGGSISTISAKFIQTDLLGDRHSVMQAEEFRHPLVMSMLMFAGEASLLGLLRLRQMFDEQFDDG